MTIRYDEVKVRYQDPKREFKQVFTHTHTHTLKTHTNTESAHGRANVQPWPGMPISMATCTPKATQNQCMNPH